MTFGRQLLLYLKLNGKLRVRNYPFGIFCLIIVVGALTSMLWISGVVNYANAPSFKPEEGWRSLTKDSTSPETILYLDESSESTSLKSFKDAFKSENPKFITLESCTDINDCRSKVLTGIAMNLNPSVLVGLTIGKKNNENVTIRIARVDDFNLVIPFLYRLLNYNQVQVTGGTEKNSDMALEFIRFSTTLSTDAKYNDTIFAPSAHHSDIKEITFAFYTMLLLFGILFVFLFDCKVICCFKETFYLDFLFSNGLNAAPVWIVNLSIIILESLIVAALCMAVIVPFSLQSLSEFSSASALRIFMMLFLSFLFVGEMCLLLTICIRHHKAVTLSAIGVLLFCSVFILLMSIVFPNPDSVEKTPTKILACIPTVYTAKLMFEAYNQRGLTTQGILALSCTGVADFILLLLLLYLDNILVNGNGLKLDYSYPFHTEYWSPEATFEPETPEEENENVQTVVGMKPVLRLRNVDKIYVTGTCTKKEMKAVDNFTATFYENQITCLLGHNGAGKTSLISILIGKHSATNGTASIDNVSATDRLSRLALRGQIGVCEQFEVLCPHLTVQENLDFLMVAKGHRMEEEEAEAEIESLVESMGLSSDVDSPVHLLSGGQQRQLSTVMALAGNPRVVFLDEPTSGMDPVARRYLWNVLQTYKNDRAIILSTHYMDEADILADRKLFMASGKLICGGSSMFLKHAFDCGTLLSIVAKSEDKVDKLEASLTSAESTVKTVRREKELLVVQVPMPALKSLPLLVKSLEKDTEAVESFDIYPTALDEVFMRLKDMDISEIEALFHKVARRSSKEFKLDKKKPHEHEEENPEVTQQVEIVQCSPSFNKQLRAQFSMNILRMVRNKKSVACRIILPLVLIALIGLGKLLDNNLSVVRKRLGTNRTLNASQIFSGGSFADNTLVLCQTLNISSVLVDKCCTVTKDADVSYEDYVKTTDDATFSCDIDHAMNRDVNFAYRPDQSKNNYVVGFRQDAKESIRYGQSITMSGAIAPSNSSSWKMYLDKANFVRMYVPYELQFYINARVMFFLLLISLIPVTYMGDPIDDRITRVRQQFTAMGISPIAYWMSNLILHYVQYAVSFILATVMLIIIAEEVFRNVALLVGVLLPILFIGLPQCLIFFYALGSCFSEPSTIITLLLFFVQILLAVFTIATALNAAIQFALPWLWPPFAIVQMVFAACKLNDRLVTSTNVIESSRLPKLLYSHGYFINAFCAMIAHFVLSTVILYILEYRHVLSCSKNSSNSSDGETEEEDESNSDNNAVATNNANKKNDSKTVMEAHGLTKVYPNGTQAVKNLSLTALADEILVIIGPSGCGKTSTLSMIVGEQEPTEGSCVVASGERFIGSHEAARSGTLGYCPQHNPLFDEVTVEELLTFYARLRGVVSLDLDMQVDFLIRHLSLHEHRHKWTCQLSGGNKRRLCMGVAMLGNPSLLLVDEVSTGVDPVTMRSIWKCLKSFINPTKGVILSTHSMEEAEALATKVAIVNKGQLVTFGSLQEQKKTFGQNYTIEVLLDIPEGKTLDELRNNFIAAFKMKYKNAAVLETIMCTIQVAVPKKSIPVISIFLEWMTENMSQWNVKYFTFFQETMDQVFVKLIRHNDMTQQNLKTHKIDEQTV